jgi:hypothetical protein
VLAGRVTAGGATATGAVTGALVVDCDAEALAAVDTAGRTALAATAGASGTVAPVLPATAAGAVDAASGALAPSAAALASLHLCASSMYSTNLPCHRSDRMPYKTAPGPVILSGHLFSPVPAAPVAEVASGSALTVVPVVPLAVVFGLLASISSIAPRADSTLHTVATSMPVPVALIHTKERGTIR